MNASAEGYVGIFWMLPDGRLIVDTTPVSLAERYGRFRIHSASHIDVWERLKQANFVTQEVDYDEIPRGRIAYDVVVERYTILADQCILADTALVASLYQQFGLPEGTIEDRDHHYRCPHCLWGSGQD